MCVSVHARWEARPGDLSPALALPRKEERERHEASGQAPSGGAVLEVGTPKPRAGGLQSCKSGRMDWRTLRDLMLAVGSSWSL